MRDYGINKGLVQEFQTSDRRSKGVWYGFRKMFWHYLNILGVPFYDPCCPTASTAGSSSFLAAPQDDVAAGAGGSISVTNYLTTINTDADENTFTLADGARVGQVKKIQLVVDGGGNAVVTPATLVGGTILIFDTAADFVVLTWSSDGWVVIENSGVVIS